MLFGGHAGCRLRTRATQSCTSPARSSPRSGWRRPATAPW